MGMNIAASHKRASGLAVSALTVGLLVWLVAPHMGSVGHDLARVSPVMAVASVLMGVVALLLRGEVWRICLHAATGSEASRHELHAANSFGMLGNSVNHYMGPPMRISVLRRLLPHDTPRPAKMLACDVPVLLVEVSVALLFFAAAVGAAGLPWWLPLVGMAVICLLVSALWSLRRRWAEKSSFLEGFNIMASPQLKRMLVLILGAILLQFGRTYLLLWGVGLHPAFWQVAMTFCGTGLLGVLPLGPATSSGATMAIFGAQSATAAAAAGIMLTTAAMVAALVYAVWGGYVLARHLVSPTRPAMALAQVST
jgi:hypothetical protein